MKTYTEPEQERKNRTPEENMAELSNRVSGNKDVLENGKQLAETATGWAELKDDDPKLKQFRTNDVKGGALACAKVVSTILKAQGLLDRVELGVDATANALIKKGWTDVQPQGEKPQPGDVIVWAAVGGGVKQSPNGPVVYAGHKHIGIATGPNECISNSSSQKRPRKHSIYTGRPVIAILRRKPDKNRQSSPQSIAQRQSQEVESTRPRKSNEPIFIDPKLEAGSEAKKQEVITKVNKYKRIVSNEAILRATAKYDSLIKTAASKNNIPESLIRAIMYTESGARPNLASHAGAGGLMQIIPAAMPKNLRNRCYPPIKKGRGYQLRPDDIRNDPAIVIDRGAEILASNLKRYNGNVILAAAAYNAGAGNVKKYGNRVPPFTETMAYVRIVGTIKENLDKSA